MTVNANDIIRATAVLEGPSGKIENVYQFRCVVVVGGDDTDVMTDLAQKLDDAYTHLVASMSSDTVFIEVQGFNVTQDAPMPTVPWPSVTAGSASANDMASQVSFLALFRTGVSRVLGRKFLGGFAREALTADGFVSSGSLTAIAGYIGELIGIFIAASLTSYQLGVLSTVTHTFFAFFEGVAQVVPGSQRRRRQGRGI
jgi:hypothetical protein